MRHDEAPGENWREQFSPGACFYGKIVILAEPAKAEERIQLS